MFPLYLHPKRTTSDDVSTDFLLKNLYKAYLFIVLHRGKAQVNCSFVLKQEMIISDRLTQTTEARQPPTELSWVLWCCLGKVGYLKGPGLSETER